MRCRQLTRHFPMNSLSYYAEEFDINISVYDIDEKKIAYYTYDGKKLVPEGESSRIATRYQREGVEFGINNNRKKFKHTAKVILWESHFIPYEQTPFNMNSAELIRHLLIENKLKPICNRQARLYQEQLPQFEPQNLASYSSTFFKSAQQVLSMKLYDSYDNLKSITVDNLSEHMTTITEENATFVSYNLFLNYLVKHNLNILSMSASAEMPVRWKQSPPKEGAAAEESSALFRLSLPLPLPY